MEVLKVTIVLFLVEAILAQDYTDQMDWTGECGIGGKQSPINIVTRN